MNNLSFTCDKEVLDAMRKQSERVNAATDVLLRRIYLRSAYITEREPEWKPVKPRVFNSIVSSVQGNLKMLLLLHPEEVVDALIDNSQRDSFGNWREWASKTTLRLVEQRRSQL